MRTVTITTQLTFHQHFRYSLMRKCWDESPEGRPTFSEITTMLSSSILPDMPLNDSEMLDAPSISPALPERLYDHVAANTDDEVNETDDSRAKTVSRMEGEDDSLFRSIVSLLPSSYKDNYLTDEEPDARVNESGRSSPATKQSDYYTEMSPIKKSSGVRSATQSSSNYYNQLISTKRENLLTRNSGHMTKTDSFDRPRVTVARSGSNVSDYFPMYPAGPARNVRPGNQERSS